MSINLIDSLIEEKFKKLSLLNINLRNFLIYRVNYSGESLQDTTLLADDFVSFVRLATQTFPVLYADVNASSDGNNYIVSYTSDRDARVIAFSDNYSPSGNVTLNGNFLEGQIIKIENNINDYDGLGEFSYEWFRDGIIIPNENSNNLLLTQSDVNKKITAEISYTDQNGTLEKFSTNESETIVNVNNTPTGNIKIIGELNNNVFEGQELSISLENIYEEDGFIEENVSYDWYLNDELISNGDTFTLLPQHVIGKLYVKGSYQDNFGENENIFSNTVIIQNTNNEPENIELRVNYNNSTNIKNYYKTEENIFSQTHSSLLYENSQIELFWEDLDGFEANDVNVSWFADQNLLQSGQGLTSITLDQNAVGKKLSALVEYTDNFTTSENFSIDIANEVLNINNPLVGYFNIVGQNDLGSEISVDLSNLEDLDGIDFERIEFSWFRVKEDGQQILFVDNKELNVEKILFANQNTHTLTPDDLNNSIAVELKVFDNFGNYSYITSHKTPTFAFTASIDKWGGSGSTWLDGPVMKLHIKDNDVVSEAGIDLSLKDEHPGHKHKPDVDKGTYELRVEHDQDTDGAINIDDVMGVLSLSRGITQTTSDEHKLAADWNGDGIINIDDVMGVLSRSRGIVRDDEWRFYDKDSDTSLWDKATKTNKMDIVLEDDKDIELSAILRGDVNASYNANQHNRADPSPAPTPNLAPLPLNNDDELIAIQLDIL